MAGMSSYKTFLMYKGASGTAYTKLVDIKDFSDLGGKPEMLQTTTLSDKMHTYASGIQSLEALTFTANYTPDDFATVKALEGQETAFAVWLGGTEGPDGTVTPTGELGKFEFSGQLSVHVNGAGVNEVVNMTISIAPSTIISFVEN